MHHSMVVCIPQSAAECSQIYESFVNRKRSPLPVAQNLFHCWAIDETLYKKSEIQCLIKPIEWNDVGMSKLFESTSFAFEASEDGGILGEISVKDFHRKWNVAIEIPHKVDNAHTPCSNECIHTKLVKQDTIKKISCH
jgi:hypothetical protein